MFFYFHRLVSCVDVSVLFLKLWLLASDKMEDYEKWREKR
jgi:hypothetical protein